MLNTAKTAARKAGTVILQALDRLDRIKVTEKSRNDFVTEIDQRAEKIIIETLQTAYPDHAFLGEETGETTGTTDSEHTWIIDPIDGTKNFIRGFPHFCVSIALKYGQHIEHGLIYDPIRNEYFTASRGKGAHYNDQRIRVSQTHKLIDSLLGTGFPHRTPERVKQYCKGLFKILPIVSGVRRAGSAALDLAYVACGRLDGFWEFDLKPWDIAAGALIVQEAGGFVSGMTGKEDYLETGNVIAANPKIHQALLKTLEDAQ